MIPFAAAIAGLIGHLVDSLGSQALTAHQASRLGASAAHHVLGAHHESTGVVDGVPLAPDADAPAVAGFKHALANIVRHAERGVITSAEGALHAIIGCAKAVANGKVPDASDAAAVEKLIAEGRAAYAKLQDWASDD